LLWARGRPPRIVLKPGSPPPLFYLVSYALVKLGAFLIVAQLGGTGERHVEIEDFTGLAHRQPAHGRMLVACFCSRFLDCPWTAGVSSANSTSSMPPLESNLIWLAILLALNSVIGAYYYLRVMVAMYMARSKNQENRIRAGAVDALHRVVDRSGPARCT